jgi:hypothetical protein
MGMEMMVEPLELMLTVPVKAPELMSLVVMPVPVREVERVLVVAGLWRAGKSVQGSETKRVRSR